MDGIVKLFSNSENEIYKFLNSFFKKENKDNINKYESSTLEWENLYKNPVEMANIIGVYIENKENFKINMWICLDKDLLINVTNQNADKIIRYLYERYPY